MTTLLARTPSEMSKIGKLIGSQLSPGDCISLEGELGGGKTTLCKGIVAGYLGISEDEVTSPAFSLVQEYSADDNRTVYHIDFYRLESISDHDFLMFSEYFDDMDAVCLVEWGDKGTSKFRDSFLRIRLSFVDSKTSETRQLNIEPMGDTRLPLLAPGTI